MTDQQTIPSRLKGSPQHGGQTVPDVGTVPESGTVSSWRAAIASERGPRHATTRHVLLTVAQHLEAHDPPSSELLAVQTALPERVVRSHIENAVQAGWLALDDAGRYRPSVAPDVAKTPRRRADVTFLEFVKACKADGVLPIPADDPLFAYAERVGLPEPWVNLAWLEFCERYDQSGKRYKDWRRVFRNAVEGNWFKLWWFRGRESGLTTAGEQARRKHGLPCYAEDDILAGAI